MDNNISQHLKTQRWFLLAGLGACFFFLAAVLIFAGIMLLVEPSPEGDTVVGIILLALAIVFVVAGSLTIKFGRRYREKTSTSMEITNKQLDYWHKPIKAPAWTDWLYIGMPIVMVFPLFFIAKEPLSVETILMLGGTILFLEMIFVPVIIWTRSKPISLALAPEGLLLTMRNGKKCLLDTGGVSGVTLDLVAVSRYGNITVYGVEILHNSRKHTFLEPMSSPIPDIAFAVAGHLKLEVQFSKKWLDRWGPKVP